MNYTIVLPCHFGMEAVLKRELMDLGYRPKEVDNGRVLFTGDALAVCRANLFLRTAERVMLMIGRFRAETFEELFDGIRDLNWEDYLPKNARFWVTKASSIDSKLFSASDIQSIAKKAMVERMKHTHALEWFPEDGADYPIRIFLKKDMVHVMLDTTGASLHKRGYRKRISKAPISETLAAALLMLTPWRDERLLWDPFCGSGTFLIEAAMIAARKAPGRERDFICRHWDFPGLLEWNKAIEEADDLVKTDVCTNLYGSDIDPAIIELAKENAKDAGCDKLIHFTSAPIKEISCEVWAQNYGFLVTNPPYGERIEDEDMFLLYQSIGDVLKKLPTWSMYMITGYEDAQKAIGKQADKNRKIYNGMLKTYYYQYFGPKPPKRGPF